MRSACLPRRPAVAYLCLVRSMKTAPRLLTAAALFSLIAGAIASAPHHFFRFTSNTPGSARSGTLTYSHGDHIITGPVFVRTTYSGDFLFLFTDRAGKKLVELQQDPLFARVRGQLVAAPWEGEIRSAPANLRNWLSLSSLFVNQVVPLSLRKTTGSENFEFHFPTSPSMSHMGF
jgi:hypothetical protein